MLTKRVLKYVLQRKEDTMRIKILLASVIFIGGLQAMEDDYRIISFHIEDGEIIKDRTEISETVDRGLGLLDDIEQDIDNVYFVAAKNNRMIAVPLFKSNKGKRIACCSMDDKKIYQIDELSSAQKIKTFIDQILNQKPITIIGSSLRVTDIAAILEENKETAS